MKEKIAEGIRQWYMATYGDVLEAEDYEDLADGILHIVQASPIAWAASVDTLAKLKVLWHDIPSDAPTELRPYGFRAGMQETLEILGLYEAVTGRCQSCDTGDGYNVSDDGARPCRVCNEGDAKAVKTADKH